MGISLLSLLDQIFNSVSPKTGFRCFTEGKVFVVCFVLGLLFSLIGFQIGESMWVGLANLSPALQAGQHMRAWNGTKVLE